jgi:RimJ/RimL family protein N-acetyltransferase
MYGPVIEGKLVRLRPPRADDAAVMVTWFEDMEVTRFLLLRNPPSMDMEKEWLEKMAKDPDQLLWVVEHEGRAVGVTGIHQINWKDGFGTTGTIIGDKGVWGRGLGRELMLMRAHYAFTQLPLRKLKSGYLDGNKASARAQAAAGYKEVGRHHADRYVDGRWVDEVITEVRREDWKKGQPKPRARRKPS